MPGRSIDAKVNLQVNVVATDIKQQLDKAVSGVEAKLGRQTLSQGQLGGMRREVGALSDTIAMRQSQAIDQVESLRKSQEARAITRAILEASVGDTRRGALLSPQDFANKRGAAYRRAYSATLSGVLDPNQIAPAQRAAFQSRIAGLGGDSAENVEKLRRAYASLNKEVGEYQRALGTLRNATNVIETKTATLIEQQRQWAEISKRKSREATTAAIQDSKKLETQIANVRKAQREALKEGTYFSSQTLQTYLRQLETVNQKIKSQLDSNQELSKRQRRQLETSFARNRSVLESYDSDSRVLKTRDQRNLERTQERAALRAQRELEQSERIKNATQAATRVASVSGMSDLDLRRLSPRQLLALREELTQARGTFRPFTASTLSGSAMYGAAQTLAQTLGVGSRDELITATDAAIARIKGVERGYVNYRGWGRQILGSRFVEGVAALTGTSGGLLSLRERYLTGDGSGGGVGGGGGRGGPGAGGSRPYGRGYNTAFNRANHMITNVSQMAGMSLYGMGGVGLFTATNAAMFNEASRAETMRNTLAGMVNTYAEFVDLQGQSLSKAEAFNMALDYSQEAYVKIRQRAVESILTTNEMFDYVLSGGGALMKNAGLNFDQMLNVVDKISSIGKAMGYQTTAVQSDIRDFAMGTVTTRSQVLRTIGFTSEDIKRARDQGPDAFMRYFEQVMAGFNPALARIQQTPQGMQSRFFDAIQNMGIRAGEAAMPAYMESFEIVLQEFDKLVKDGTIEDFGRFMGEATLGLVQFIAGIGQVVRFIEGLGINVTGGTAVTAGLATAGGVGAGKLAAVMAGSGPVGWAVGGTIAAGTLVYGSMAATRDARAQMNATIPQLLAADAARNATTDARGYRATIQAELDRRAGRGSGFNPDRIRAEIKELQDLRQGFSAVGAMTSLRGDQQGAQARQLLERLGGESGMLKLLEQYDPSVASNFYLLPEDLARIAERELTDRVEQLRNNIKNRGPIGGNVAASIRGMGTNQLQELLGKVNMAIEPRFGGTGQETEEGRQKRADELLYQSAVMRAGATGAGYRLSGLADTDPRRAVILAQQMQFNQRAASLRYQSEMLGAADNPLAQQQAALEYSNTIKDLNAQFEESLRTLRETILLKRDELAITRQQLDLLRRRNDLEEQEFRLGLINPATQQGFTSYLSALGQIRATSNAIAGQEYNIAYASEQSQIDALARNADPFERVITFFQGLKDEGFPAVRLNEQDIASYAAIYDSVNQTINNAANTISQSTTVIADTLSRVANVAATGGSALPGRPRTVTGDTGHMYIAGAYVGRSNRRVIDQGQKGVADSILDGVEYYLNTPYVWGGNDIRKGVDCSGLVNNIFRQVEEGINDSLEPGQPKVSSFATRNRTAAGMYKAARREGRLVSRDNVQHGDVVWWTNATHRSNRTGYGHVGFIVEKNGELYVTEAAGGKARRVIERPLKDVEKTNTLEFGRPHGYIPVGANMALPNAQVGNVSRSASSLQRRIHNTNQAIARETEDAQLKAARRTYLTRVAALFGSRADRMRTDADFVAQQRLSLIGLTGGEATIQQRLNDLDLQMFTLDSTYQDEVGGRRMFNAERLARIADERIRARETFKNDPQGLEAALSRLQEREDRITAEQLNWELSFQQRKTGLMAEQRRIQTSVQRELEKQNKELTKQFAAMEDGRTLRIGTYGAVGLSGAVTRAGVVAGISNRQATTRLTDAQTEYEKALTNLVQLRESNAPGPALGYAFARVQIARQALEDASNAVVSTEITGMNATAQANLNLDISNRNQAERVAALSRRAGLQENLFGTLTERLFGSPRGTSLLESARTAEELRRSNQLAQVDTTLARQRMAYIGTLRLMGVAPRVIEGMLTEYDRQEPLRRAQMLNSINQGSNQRLFRLNTNSMRQADLLNQGTGELFAAFANNPLGLISGGSGRQDLLSAMYQPLIGDTMGARNRNFQVASSLLTGRFNDATLSGLGYMRMPVPGQAVYRGPDGNLISAASLRNRALTGAAADLGGMFLGNLIGQRVFNGDPTAVNFGSQLGGALGPSLFQGLGAFGGPVGMVLGGALGGLFSRRRNPQDEQMAAWRRDVIRLLSSMDKSLRPRPGYDPVNSQVLYGEASRFLGGRASDTIQRSFTVGTVT
ncbi:hypothetical protein [Microcystis phage Mvi-JY20]|uniref:NlpC/P60 domain-containing protein n=1 Tax=Microcystis phage Mvi-JY20 TaxID=3128146 RepID=A0AAX4QI14_9CAUD